MTSATQLLTAVTWLIHDAIRSNAYARDHSDITKARTHVRNQTMAIMKQLHQLQHPANQVITEISVQSRVTARTHWTAAEVDVYVQRDINMSVELNHAKKVWYILIHAIFAQKTSPQYIRLLLQIYINTS